VVNVASVSAPGDVNAGNDRASDLTVVNGAPDLQTVKRGAGPFTVGANGTYAVTVTNVGTLGTSGPTSVVDALPAGLTFVSGTGGGWTFNATGQTVTATHAGSIAAGDSASFTLTVAVG